MKTPNINPRHNYLQLLVGIIFMILGAWVLITPVQFITVYSLLFGIAFITTGVLEIMYALSNKTKLNDWIWALIGGSIDLLAGIMLSLAHISTEGLADFVGLVFLFRSVRTIRKSMRLKEQHATDWSWLLFNGIIALMLALTILLMPTLGGRSIFFYAALSYMITGVVQVYISITRKSFGHQ